MNVNEGESCVIDEGTRSSLEFSAELLGADVAELEKAMISKTMAVRTVSYWRQEHPFLMTVKGSK